MKYTLLACCLLPVVSAAPAGAGERAPTIDQMLGLRCPVAARVSPDGQWVAYEVQKANWGANAFETEVWVAAAAGAKNYRLTAGKGSSRGARWSPDGKRLAFLSDRDGKQQLYVIAPDGGEAAALTDHETAVTQFRWSPDGRHIAFTAPDPEGPERKGRKEKYGSFEVFEGDHAMTHLWRVEVPAEPPAKLPKAERLSEGDAFSVGGFEWSPDGRRVAFDATRTPAVRDIGTADIYVLTVADRAVKKVVGTKGADRNPAWSPDGKQIAYESANDRDDFFYRNSVLAVVPAEGGEPRVLTADFDERPMLHAWGPGGLYFSAQQKTDRHLYRLDPSGKAPERLGSPAAPANAHAAGGYTFSADFKSAAFLHAGAGELPEVCAAPPGELVPRRLTDFGKQLKEFRLGRREVVRWKSADGTTIEGVLTKPPDFDATKKYPLLVVIHGGPTALDTPAFPRPFAYPLAQFVAKGALVLQPNYRGSAGYGEKFRALNVRNLGVGDYEDVISGVDDLIGRGFVDRGRVGAMGWSQGGYISAFITCSSDRFKAVSVGAGISDWATYYVNTDIPPFTRQYLKATPWDDPEVYRKTSPITYLKSAKTPTLIQHGDRDERVPIPNAYELYRGLKDQGVPVRLVVYKGHDHGVYKPKEQRALMEQNWEWFCEHLWGEKPAAAATAEEELKSLEREWAEAEVKGDTKFHERVLADDFTFTGPDGVLADKKAYLAPLRAGEVRYESLKFGDVAVQLHGETAVVTGRATAKGRVKDKDVSGEYRFTDVFVKRDGRWRCVAGQLTRVAER
jgi:dipeptidyl aminopeptidase/acylaminoacyl peptidase/ketosteroid isomerase-like protein